MIYTVEDLICILGEADPESEVRIASCGYKSYFEYGIDDVLVDVDISDPDDEDIKLVVYLSEGPQIGYLPGVVRDELGV